MTRLYFYCFLGSLFCLAARGEVAPPPVPNDPPIDVTFYYSIKDPHLADAEKALADAVKQMPQIRISRVPIDTKEGYTQLAQEEQRLHIKEPGEMTMVFGPIYLTSKGDKRYIETCFASSMKRMIAQMKGDRSFKGRIPVDIPGYTKELFGAGYEARVKEGTADDPIVYYRILREGKTIGWVVDAFHPIGCPICGDTQFVLATNANLVVTDIRPVHQLERWAEKLPVAETAAFLAQIRGKAPADVPLKVDVISSSTKTSLAYQAALNEILEELKKRGN